MDHLTHHLEIHSPPDRVFEACRNVCKWSQFMPAVKHATFVQESGVHDIVCITAEANNEIWTWRSKRMLNRARLLITFERLDPPWPILSMSGKWLLIPLPHGVVQLQLEHCFLVSTDSPEKREFLVESIKRNATRDLAALREYCEAQDHK